MALSFDQLLVLYSSVSQGSARQVVTDPEDYLTDDTTQVSSFLKEHEIRGMAKGYAGYHWKVDLIRPTPYLLYFKGDIDLLNKQIIGIVGPRRPSPYATDITKSCVTALAGRDVVTISGGAKGIDMIAHTTSLAYDIPTILVLGGGFRYYHQHRSVSQLIDRIVAAGGLVISERKIDLEPAKYTFPQRNRIIAGLADKLFVPGAGKKSGSLITVDYALRMKKPVFGVPAMLNDAASAGSNAYLADGKMQMVTDLQAFIEDEFPTNTTRDVDLSTYLAGLSPSQKSVIDLFAQEKSLTVEHLVDKIGLPIAQILIIINELEQTGCIQETTPGRYTHLLPT